jgi:hypothetical protein
LFLFVFVHLIWNVYIVYEFKELILFIEFLLKLIVILILILNMKKYFNKFVSNIFFKKKNNKKSDLIIKENTSKLTEQIKNYLGHIETKSTIYDYQNTLNYIYSKKSPTIISKEKEKIENEVKKEVKETEEKIISNFFNKYSLKIIQNSNSDTLIDLACKSFVGSIGL